jgi:hypothetical protein
MNTFLTKYLILINFEEKLSCTKMTQSFVTFLGEITVKKTRVAKVNFFFQGLCMTCVIFVSIYNFKICISNAPFNIAF